MINFIAIANAAYIFDVDNDGASAHIIKSPKDKNLDEKVYEDAAKATPLALTVADGVGGWAFNSRYMASILVDTFAKTIHEAKEHNIMYSPLKTVDILADPLFNSVKEYDGILERTAFFELALLTKNNELNEKQKERLNNLKNKTIYGLKHNLGGGSTLVGAYLKQTNSGPALNIVQAGDSLTLVMKQKQSSGRIYYYPEMITDDMQDIFNAPKSMNTAEIQFIRSMLLHECSIGENQPDFLNKMYKKIIDESLNEIEVPVETTDLIIMGSDGLFDNIPSPLIAIFIQFVLACLELAKEQGKETIENPESLLHNFVDEYIEQGSIINNLFSKYKSQIKQTRFPPKVKETEQHPLCEAFNYFQETENVYLPQDEIKSTIEYVRGSEGIVKVPRSKSAIQKKKHSYINDGAINKKIIIDSGMKESRKASVIPYKKNKDFANNQPSAPKGNKHSFQFDPEKKTTSKQITNKLNKQKDDVFDSIKSRKQSIQQKTKANSIQDHMNKQGNYANKIKKQYYDNKEVIPYRGQKKKNKSIDQIENQINDIQNNMKNHQEQRVMMLKKISETINSNKLSSNPYIQRQTPESMKQLKNNQPDGQKELPAFYNNGELLRIKLNKQLREKEKESKGNSLESANFHNKPDLRMIQPKGKSNMPSFIEKNTESIDSEFHLKKRILATTIIKKAKCSFDELIKMPIETAFKYVNKPVISNCVENMIKNLSVKKNLLSEYGYSVMSKALAGAAYRITQYHNFPISPFTLRALDFGIQAPGVKPDDISVVTAGIKEFDSVEEELDYYIEEFKEFNASHLAHDFKVFINNIVKKEKELDNNKI